MIRRFILGIIVSGFVLLPSLSYALDNQCTTDELDLVCQDGQVLQSINADGSTTCVVALADKYGGVYTLNFEKNATNNAYKCRHPNPLNNNRCGCPEGLHPYLTLVFDNATCEKGYYGDGGIRNICGVHQYLCAE